MGKQERKYTRYKIFADLEIFVKKQKIIGAAYNISRGGMNFVADKELKPGDSCKITMRERAQFSISLEGQIVYASMINSVRGVGKYGLSFDKIIEKTEVDVICEIFKLAK